MWRSVSTDKKPPLQRFLSFETRSPVQYLHHSALQPSLACEKEKLSTLLHRNRVLESAPTPNRRRCISFEPLESVPARAAMIGGFFRTREVSLLGLLECGMGPERIKLITPIPEERITDIDHRFDV